jgi:hypothetical protein
MVWSPVYDPKPQIATITILMVSLPEYFSFESYCWNLVKQTESYGHHVVSKPCVNSLKSLKERDLSYMVQFLVTSVYQSG